MNREDLIIYDANPATIRAAVLADYEALTGRTVLDAQPEMLLLNVFAYRETLIREQANEAIRQSLVAYATAPMLDNLGEFVGVTRLPASGALTTLTFTGSGANTNPVVIASGTRVATDDGQFVFETTADATLAAGATSVSVEAACQTTGEAANNKVLSVVLDPVPFVVGFSATPPSGGNSGETDEQLRERIRLAPNAFSVAGPAAAYKFFAKSAHPDIIDVSVSTPRPGVVQLVPLVPGGVPSPEILSAVLAACNADTVRPICDTVRVVAPTVRTYTLAVELELYTGTPAATARAAATAALTNYTAERAAGLGRDIVREQLLARAMVGGVYRANVRTPAASLVVAEAEVAICTSVTVTVTGFNNG